MTTPAEVRQQIIEALKLDLIGPSPHHAPEWQEEIIDQAPSKWYLSGFLVSTTAPVELKMDDSPDADDDLEAIPKTLGTEEKDAPETTAARRSYFPSSMGMSVLLPPHLNQLEVVATWGEYRPLYEAAEIVTSGDQSPEVAPDQDLTHDQPQEPQKVNPLEIQVPWQRRPCASQLRLNLANHPPKKTYKLPKCDGLYVEVYLKPIDAEYFPAGTRSVSLFLVNHRTISKQEDRDLHCLFQAQLAIASSVAFLPRVNLQGRKARDWDEKIADLQYRYDAEYGVGHNVSVQPELTATGECYRLRTEWIPEAMVSPMKATAIAGVELTMETLAQIADAPTLQRHLGNIPHAYGQWIAAQEAGLAVTHPDQKTTARDLYREAKRVQRRIQEGIDTLGDPLVFEAFQLMNRAIATAIRQRLAHDTEKTPADFAPPQWRPFQLAFILMNLAGMVDPHHGDREGVDLLFFPTGGGKTEAYLGLAAFTILLRRLRDPSIHGAGLSVIMRYTLRLLTLDQLSRATTLICALELERQRQPDRLGAHPLEIGLWVGQAATPNRMGYRGDKNPDSAYRRTHAYKNNPGGKPVPIPLEKCPWCGQRLGPESFNLEPDPKTPKRLTIQCTRRSCAFRRNKPLPIVAVDESIYQRLPCFLIATVDKFASLPWVGETAKLFGKVHHYDPNHQEFFGATDIRAGRALERPLLPPDLIIQDELHLISGPLGTMVGLYETAIEHLCSHTLEGKTIKPKIVASTATVKRAEQQIRALFGRADVTVFPPPGADRHDAFFAQTIPPSEAHPRIYLGVAAQGRSAKVILLRTYLALLGAAQKAWEAAGGADNPHNPADPYMTLLGYFNSLRELGGSRRIVEDEIQSKLQSYGDRQRQNHHEGLFCNRKINNEPAELTSRESTSNVANTKRRLSRFHGDPDRIDVALATNMISVGLDITRLGLMVVLGQPKSAAEYIQSTSRVGREEQRPGLVVTLLNVHRPRDRSHYERFKFWHDTFYRAVEATSVTPFSPRALDRGLAGVTVALSRLDIPEMTPPQGAQEVRTHRPQLEAIAALLEQRAEQHHLDFTAEMAHTVRDRVRKLFDLWEKIVNELGDLQYQKEESTIPPLLYDFLDPDLENLPAYRKSFRTQRSLRDVEPAVNLWVKNLPES